MLIRSVLMFFVSCWLVPFIVVASNPSPYFAALALVCAAGFGGLILILGGFPYICLILFLVYLGGMLVVFAFVSAIASDSYLETFGQKRILSTLGIYSMSVFTSLFAVSLFFSMGYLEMWRMEHEYGMTQAEVEYLGVCYEAAGWVLMTCGWALLLALIIVVRLARGHIRRALRSSK